MYKHIKTDFFNKKVIFSQKNPKQTHPIFGSSSKRDSDIK